MRKALAIAFWLLVWECAAISIGESILLVSPIAVFLRLIELVFEPVFLESIAYSLSKIILGFTLSSICAVLLAYLSHERDVVRTLISPLALAVKSTPVASIVIIVLIYVSSSNLSVVISSMMVFPVVYASVLEGLDNAPKELLEMAYVFRIPKARVVKSIYVPSAFPYLSSSLSTAMGLAWKSGIAAEVIGIPRGSIGERLYEAKLFFSSADVLAWTVTIIFLSFASEKILSLILSSFRRPHHV